VAIDRRRIWNQEIKVPRSSRFDDKLDRCANFVVDLDVHKFWGEDDVDSILRQVTLGESHGFHGLIHGTGPDGLDFSALVFPDHASDSACNSGSARDAFYFDDIYLWPFLNVGVHDCDPPCVKDGCIGLRASLYIDSTGYLDAEQAQIPRIFQWLKRVPYIGLLLDFEAVSGFSQRVFSVKLNRSAGLL
jgi:hypothetical protein